MTDPSSAFQSLAARMEAPPARAAGMREDLAAATASTPDESGRAPVTVGSLGSPAGLGPSLPEPHDPDAQRPGGYV